MQVSADAGESATHSNGTTGETDHQGFLQIFMVNWGSTGHGLYTR